MLRERILLAELAVGTVDLAELGLTVGSQPESRADGRDLKFAGSGGGWPAESGDPGSGAG